MEEAEVRLQPNSRKVEGYGIVFNKLSQDLGGFREIIAPGAIEGVVERSDILALLNHDISKGVLARSTNGKGTMKIEADKKGAKYTFEAPKFAAGEELVEGIERGDIRGSSFAFTIADPENDQKWERQEDGTYLRTILKFGELFDMSPVYREAYQDTTVALRSMDKIVQPPEKPKVEEVRKEEVKPVVEDTPKPIAPDMKDDLYRRRTKELDDEYRNQINEFKKMKK